MAARCGPARLSRLTRKAIKAGMGVAGGGEQARGAGAGSGAGELVLGSQVRQALPCTFFFFLLQMIADYFGSIFHCCSWGQLGGFCPTLFFVPNLLKLDLAQKNEFYLAFSSSFSSLQSHNTNLKTPRSCSDFQWRY